MRSVSCLPSVSNVVHFVLSGITNNTVVTITIIKHYYSVNFITLSDA